MFLFYQIAIIYTDIHLTKHVDNICYFYKKAPTTIAMVGISNILFKGNLSSELNLIFIYFSSKLFEFLVIDLITSLILIHRF